MDFDDLPPLEDMSAEIEKRRFASNPFPKPNPHKFQPTIPVLSTKPPSTNNTAKSSGLKKGFLLSSSSTKQKITSVKVKSDSDEIPLIKPTSTPNSKDSLRIDEVQDAMKPYWGINESEWMTPSLLQSIESNPTLSKAFADPEFTQAISEICNPSQNPQAALAKWSQKRPEFVAAFKEFMRIMGNQFEQIADKKEKEALEKNMEGLSTTEREFVGRVLGDDEVRSILSDVKVQKLLANIREHGLDLRQ